MKISKGYIKTAFKVTDKETRKHYDCFLQNYEYLNGHHETRYNIGINGHHDWSFIHYVSEERFNEKYTID